MTPAIKALKRAKIPYVLHEYEHDASAESFGDEAASKLGLPADQVFKTLVVALDGKTLAVAILPVSHMLSLKAVAKAFKAKKAAMAEKNHVQKTTGYVLGGVSPVGQKKLLPTLIDSSAQQFGAIYVSAGRRGLQMELSPADLAQLVRARFENIIA